MADDYHGDQSEGKRYSVDHGDSAFGSISSSYSSKSSYGFRSSQQFSGSLGSVSMCRQPASSPNMFPDGNRTGERPPQHKPVLVLTFVPPRGVKTPHSVLSGGYNVSPESQESKAPANKDPTMWSVEDVVWFIRDADPQALGPHADIFRKHVSRMCVQRYELLGV